MGSSVITLDHLKNLHLSFNIEKILQATKVDPELRARLLRSYHEQNMERAMERKARSEVVRKELPSIRDLIQLDLINFLFQSKV